MKRYTDENQILERIDKYTREIEALDKSANSLDAQADTFRNTKNDWQIEKVRILAANMRKRAVWRAGRLSMLKEKLAEFRTGVLPFVEDGSVAA